MSRPNRPRIRYLKPEAWQDERVAGVSRDARLLYVGLITQADDAGRGTANPAVLKANVLTFDADASAEAIEGWLREAEAADLIRLYEVDGRRFYAVVSWSEDQRVDKPSPSKIPPPPEFVANGREESRSVAIVPAGPGPGSGTGSDLDRTDARERASGPPGEVRQVFDEWVTATERDAARTRLTPQRQRLIERALESHGLDDCLAAVRHIGADAWARGHNDRRTRFDDLKHALGSAERIERWRDQRPRTATANGGAASDQAAEWLDRAGVTPGRLA